MNNLDQPGFGRIALRQTIKDLSSEGFVGFDDELHINTQTSSQWDSLKHVRIAHIEVSLAHAIGRARHFIHIHQV